MNLNLRDEDILEYHSEPRPGKLEVQASKPCLTQLDLSIAYSPGVALPCRKIEEDPTLAYKYTGKGNLVAVVSNGTAVLGLGDIGALAGKPVMEGKGVLFKRFAGIDVFDIELNTKDADELIRTCQILEPTFGGINLEDIKAPECFHIEETLKKTMDIPVFHDDQHGTAIIAGAGLINALEIVDKSIEEIRIVVCGAGAAGIACADFFVSLGADSKKILMTDSKGVIHPGRTEGMNPYKARYAQETSCRSLADAMQGADVFCGVSVAGMVTEEMLLSMAKDPIVFAMANPDPEIPYDVALRVREDVIMATGRSDFPNQVNNVLGFPFLFRGALDVGATAINEEMKRAAALALAKLAKEPVPESVQKAYGNQKIRFGREYLIPKPFDPRVLLWEAPAVARAAMESGVARTQIDLDKYVEQLERFLGRTRTVMRAVENRARKEQKRIIFPEGCEEKVIQAAQVLVGSKIACPILVGSSQEISQTAERTGVSLEGIQIVDPATSASREQWSEEYYRLRSRRGISPHRSQLLMNDPLYFGLMMLHMDEGDGLVCGINRSYPETVSPGLQIIGLQNGVQRAAGMYMVVLSNKVLFFADATINIDPTAKELAEISVLSARTAQNFFHIEPRVALLSFSNFGNVRHPLTEKVSRAVQIARDLAPDLIIDGEMQGDTALVPALAENAFPHSQIAGDANILIFPDLQSGNIAYKLVQHLAGAEIVGPIILGMAKPVNAINHYSSVGEIVNISSITAVQASLESAPSPLEVNPTS
ncbi:MAG: NADP-dependent malic enzyme [Planctomycetota bacterium]|nr:NADP-dependent malic enzyme [Planctomycetota bacterium]